jgi:hypothetical protein
MMRNRITLLARAIALSLCCLPILAFSPVATVNSAEPFTLDGRFVAVSGVASVPLAFGDEVATSTAPAVLFFADGSSVKLAAASRAKLIGSESQPKLVLLAGSLDYKVVLGSNLSVTSLDLERNTKPAAHTVQPAAKALATVRPDQVALSVNTR